MIILLSVLSFCLIMLIVSKLIFDAPQKINGAINELTVGKYHIELVGRILLLGLGMWLAFGLRFLLSFELKNILFSVFGTLFLICSLIFSGIKVRRLP